MTTLGKCIVCKGGIHEMSFSFGANYFCKECGIAYHRLTDKLELTERGKYLKKQMER